MKGLVTLALVVVLGIPRIAGAQHVQEYTEAEKWVLTEQQLIQALQSPIEAVRVQSLKNAILFATLYRDKVDLSDAVDAIRTTCEDDRHASHRKLALAALQAIGNRKAKEYVAEHATATEAEEGRFVVASVLNEYYLARGTALD